MNVLLDWKAPPFILYSTAPIAPVAVAVKVVVPPLQRIEPATAETAIVQAAGLPKVMVFETAEHVPTVAVNV